MMNIDLGVNGYYAKYKQKGSEFHFYERLLFGRRNISLMNELIQRVQYGETPKIEA